MKEAPVLTPEMQSLIQQAEKGDRTAVEPLHQLLVEQPQLIEQFGDQAAWAERSWLDLVAGSNLVVRTSLEEKLVALREDLGEPEDAPLVQLLVRRVVASWLQVHYTDAHLAQLRQTQAPEAQLRVVDQFLNHAQARYLSAIWQLAQVRKLLKPTLSPLDIATAGVKERAPKIRARRGVDPAVPVIN